MAVTAEFRNEVKTAIAPWRSSKPRPPFSPGALLTIALVLSGDEEMTLEDMMESSSSTFSYYNYCTKGNALSALITLREKTELREYLHSAVETSSCLLPSPKHRTQFANLYGASLQLQPEPILRTL